MARKMTITYGCGHSYSFTATVTTQSVAQDFAVLANSVHTAEYPQCEMDHVLRSITLVSYTSYVYLCTCGASGVATRAYDFEDLEAKARSNFRNHAYRAKRTQSEVS